MTAIGQAIVSTSPKLDVAPGIVLWPGLLSGSEQHALVDDVFARVATAPFYRPTMPKSGKSFSVEETNFGPLGWVSDISGYRYQPPPPVTAKNWAAIPARLLTLWHDTTGYPAQPECCLVNLYRN